MFDIVVVYARDDQYIKNRNLSILHIRRKFDCGGQGAVYLGQAIAFKEGYKYFIPVTVDRIPHSRGSLMKIYKTAESKGLDYLIDNWNLVSHQATSACLGGIVRTRILPKAGLYPFPLWACDDVEYHYRLMKASDRWEYLSEPAIKIFTHPMPLFESKLIRLFRSGGFDNTNRYEAMLGNYVIPEIFLDLSFYSFATKSFFLRRMLLSVKFMFIANLFQRLFEMRLPAFREYRLNARNGIFARPVWKISSDDFTLSPPINSKVSNKKYLSSNRSGFLALMSAFLKSHSSNTEQSIYPLFYDSCRIWDPIGPTECSLSWTRKASFLKKIHCAFLASIDTFDNALRAAKNTATKKHVFDGYGVSTLPKRKN